MNLSNRLILLEVLFFHSVVKLSFFTEYQLIRFRISASCLNLIDIMKDDGSMRLFVARNYKLIFSPGPNCHAP